MAIAIYLRLSEADGDLGIDGKDESNGIENQRMLLHHYIKARDDLAGEIIEYADDGYSGTNFNRPAFKRMIEDAKKGKIHVIIVKDLSRLGRDYIVAGDYVEQIFPLLQVRFIAANNGYDSAGHTGGNMEFDLAVSNLINTFYSRDLSKKIKAANKIRWKNGISTSGHAPFGYLKSSDKKGKFVIDPEAGKIVRFIFDKALEGKSTTEIAFLLNENHYPTPWVYNQTKKNWSLAEPVTAENERLWEISMVCRVLRKYDYTGAMVMGRKRSLSVGARNGKLQPKSEWIIVEGVHEPIVTHEEFERANLVIRQKKQRNYVVGQNYPLKGKVRCGNCRKCLYYEARTYKEYFVCRHGKQVGRHSRCCTEEYSVKHIEEVVLRALREHLSMLEWLSVKAGDKAKSQMKTVKNHQKFLSEELDKLKAEKIRQYEFYADGIITKEYYIRKKSELNDFMEKLESDYKSREEEFDRQSGLWKSAANMNAIAKKFAGEQKLSRQMAEAFIENVYIYAPNRIEIVFRHEDEIAKLIEILNGENVIG